MELIKTERYQDFNDYGSIVWFTEYHYRLPNGKTRVIIAHN